MYFSLNISDPEFTSLSCSPKFILVYDIPPCFMLQDISVKDPSFQQYKTLDQLLPVNSKVFMLGSPHYGCMGEVGGE